MFLQVIYLKLCIQCEIRIQLMLSKLVLRYLGLKFSTRLSCWCLSCIVYFYDDRYVLTAYCKSYLSGEFGRDGYQHGCASP